MMPVGLHLSKERHRYDLKTAKYAGGLEGTIVACKIEPLQT